jgi:hypothetical protein
MARTNDWQREVREAVRRENWSLTGPNCIVKVVPLQRPVLSTAQPVAAAAERSVLSLASGPTSSVTHHSKGSSHATK